MSKKWTRDQLERALQLMHCFSEGHYKDLPKHRRIVVDLDVSRVMEQFDMLDRDFDTAAAFIVVAYRINEVMEQALSSLIEAKDYKDTHGKTPAYEQMRTKAWRLAKHALAVQRGDKLFDDPI